MTVPDHEFISEAEDLLEAAHRDLDVLNKQCINKTFDVSLLNSLFRSLHSLKGLSSTVGLQQASDLAHQLETCLDCLRMGRKQATEHLFELLTKSLTLLDDLVHRRSDADAHYAHMITLLEDVLADHLSPSDLAKNSTLSVNLDPDIYQSLTAFEVEQLQRCLQTGQDVFLIGCCLALADMHTTLPEFEQLLCTRGQLLATIPGVPQDTGRIEFHFLFCGSLSNDLAEKYLTACRVRVRAIAQRHNQKIVSPVRQLHCKSETKVEVAKSSHLVRVESHLLDELSEIAKHLVLGQGQLKRHFQQFSEEDGDESRGAFERSFQELERGLVRLQRSLNDARMIPVRFLFQRMTRIVRTAERGTGKRVHLITRGNEVPLDRAVLEQLNEPLLHLVRNAIDHGIESPDSRVSFGKPAEGTLVLEAFQRSGHVAIEIRDDGRGIDLKKVQDRACELGIVKTGEVLSKQKLYDLLVQPGFSTRSEVSELSGRGVGMDVVRCHLETLCGTVEIDTEEGTGTCITLTLPVHKTVMQVLVVTVAGRAYAISLEGVACVKPFETGIAEQVEEDSVSSDQEPLPLLDLRDYFPQSSLSVKDKSYLVVAGLGSKQVGLIVDGLVGRREAVIRPFGALLRQVPDFSAVAELVATGPVLLLDLAYLMHQATLRSDPKVGQLTYFSAKVKAGVEPLTDPHGKMMFWFNDSSLPRGNDLAESSALAHRKGNYLSFFLGGDEYALDIREVVEIIENAVWIQVPSTPYFISGVTLWRDQMIPVLDVTTRMGLAPLSEITCGTVLVSTIGDQKVAVVAERLGQLFHATPVKERSTEPISSQRCSSFFSDIVLRNGYVVGVLDLSALLGLSDNL